MTDKIFFDTNVIINAYDPAEPRKRKIAESLLERAFIGEIKGVISNQVLGELFTVLIKRGVSSEMARVIVHSLISSTQWEKVNYDYSTIRRAAQSYTENRTHFWDLVITETMKDNGITDILTDNEKHFESVPGIRAINPFKQG